MIARVHFPLPATPKKKYIKYKRTLHHQSFANYVSLYKIFDYYFSYAAAAAWHSKEKKKYTFAISSSWYSKQWLYTFRSAHTHTRINHVLHSHVSIKIKNLDQQQPAVRRPLTCAIARTLASLYLITIARIKCPSINHHKRAYNFRDEGNEQKKKEVIYVLHGPARTEATHKSPPIN